MPLPRRSRWLWHRTERTSPTGPCETCRKTGERTNGRRTPSHAVAPQGPSHQTHGVPQSSPHGSELGKNTGSSGAMARRPTQGRARSSPLLHPASSSLTPSGLEGLLRSAQQQVSPPGTQRRPPRFEECQRVTYRPTLGWQARRRAIRSGHRPPRSEQNRFPFYSPPYFIFLNKPSKFSLLLLGGRPYWAGCAEPFPPPAEAECLKHTSSGYKHSATSPRNVTAGSTYYVTGGSASPLGKGKNKHGTRRALTPPSCPGNRI